MEGHRHHLVFVLALSLCCAGIGPAAAATSRASTKPTKPTEHPTIEVGTSPNGIDIGAQRNRTTPGSGGLQPTNKGPARITPVGQPTAVCQISPSYDGWLLVICGGVERGAVPSGDAKPGAKLPASPPRSALQVAERLAEHIPVPQVVIHANPSKGMVGVESWFWMTGYDGKPIERTDSFFGTPVSVRAVVKRYTWYFGDGATQTLTTPGTAYPRRSEIRHLYQRSSAGRTLGYLVRAEFEFAVMYRTGKGGSWRSLPAITRSATMYYPVRESQAVIQQ